MIPAIRIDPSGAYALAAAVTEQHLVPEIKTDLLGNTVHGEQAPATPWKAIYVQEGINKSHTILVKGNNTYVGPGDEYTIVAGYPSLDPLDTECSISYEHGIIFFCNTVNTVDTEFEIEYIPIGTVVDTHPVLDTVRVGEPAQAEAIGEFSASQGYTTKAYGDGSSANGNAAIASGKYSTAEGSAITGYAPQVCSVDGAGVVTIVGIDATEEFANGENVLVFALDGTPLSETSTIATDPVFAANTTFDLAAPLAYGVVTTGYIVSTHKGRYAHAEGLGTAALGAESHAEGSGTTAIGEASHTEGAEGRVYAPSKAFGYAGHAEGGGNMVMGDQAHGENEDHLVVGDNAHAEGYENFANANDSHVEGTGNTTGYSARGCTVVIPNPLNPWVCDITIAAVNCTAEFTDGHVARFYFIDGTPTVTEVKTGIISALAFGGVDTTFTMTLIGGTGTIDNLAGGYVVDTEKGIYAHAEGEGSRASGTGSHSEGKTTIASGLYSHAQNREATASGSYSHAEGFQNTASGQSSHAEGQGTTASGINAHAEGQYTSAGGVGSHAEGQDTIASGVVAHAEGDGSVASGDISHAEGEYTTASGVISHAEGSNTNTNSKAYAHAEGVFSLNRFTASHVSASGKISANGDAQYERVVIFTTTAAAITAKMRITNVTELTLPESSLFRFTAEIVAVNTANGLGCAYHVTGLVGRVGAAAANLPTPAVVVTEYEDAALAGCDVTVTVAGNNLEINAVGIAATTIRWVGSVHFTEVIYA